MRIDETTQPARLVIEFKKDSSQPRYTFEGFWTGHMISSVLRFIRRAYHMHNRGIRREEATIQPLSESTVKETQNV